MRPGNTHSPARRGLPGPRRRTLAGGGPRRALLLTSALGLTLLLLTAAHLFPGGPSAEAARRQTNNPPTVSMTSPADGAVFTAPASMTLRANAADSDGTVTKVEFFQGTTLLCTDTSSPYTCNWLNVTANTYALTAKATDNGTATTTSAAVNITVNPNSPPTVNLTAPVNGASFTVPADITLSATASDVDGTVSRVEFYKGTTLLGSDSSSPYSYSWHAPAGTHAITAKAIDNGNASTTSGAATITVVPMSVPAGGYPCPTDPASVSQQGEFTSPNQINFPLNLAPCEQITFTLSWQNGLNNGALFYITFYNYRGEELYQEAYNGFMTDSIIFPNTNTIRFPWRATRSQIGLPSYAIFKAGTPFGSPAKYNIGYTRQPRQGYNEGGESFADAKLVTLGTTEYGSLYQGTQPHHPTDPGEFYKVRLQPSQGFFISGHLTGPSFYGSFTKIELYDSAQQLIPTSVLNPNWVSASAYGRDEYKSKTFVNTGSTPADFYVRIQAWHRPLEDFEINFEVDSCPVPAEAKATAPDPTSGSAPYTVTSAEYKFPAAVDPDVLDLVTPTEDQAPGNPATGRETELWARVYRPTNLAAGPFPLVLMLHGNHGTCGRGANPRRDGDWPFYRAYAMTGACPLKDQTVTVYGSGGVPQTHTAAHDYTVVPQHNGYAYVAEQLAARGYIVVSINANRGINVMTGDIATDQALILARGRLVLKHLQRLSEWHVNGGPYAPGSTTVLQLGADLKDKIDFGNVGLMGHSRGGQGVRAAYNLYHDAGSPWPARILRPLDIKGIFEVAPTDATTTRTVSGLSVVSSFEPITNDAARKGTKWNVLIPMCDGDVVTTEGLHPFDRSLLLNAETPATQKSTLTAWGANHNFFNTEWQETDWKTFAAAFPAANLTTGCVGNGNTPLYFVSATGSPQQRQVGSASILAFFRANVGAAANATFNQSFNPRYKMPGVLTSMTRADRGFTPSPDATATLAFDNFNNPGPPSMTAAPNVKSHADVSVIGGSVPHHDPGLRSARISWTSTGADRYFQAGWGGGGASADLTGFQTLDFRISRQHSPLLNGPLATNFSIQLVMQDDSVSGAVSFCKYHDKLRGPVGGYEITPSNSFAADYRPILETVRIPLADFSGVNLSQVKGVRFIFNGTQTGAIYLTNIRFAK